MPCTLSMNGFGVHLKALADTGANGYLFINRTLAMRLSKSVASPILPLPFSVSIRGFHGQVGNKANSLIRLHLTIDGRVVYNCPFVILDLGTQDLIIGSKWMRRFQLRIDTVRNRFIWPKQYPPTPTFAKNIVIDYTPKHPRTLAATDHQQDAYRRDQLITQDQKRRREIPISIIKAAPTSCLNPSVQDTRPRAQPIIAILAPNRARHPVMICEISANAMHFNMKRKDNEFFMTSLYEIDRIIIERETPETLQLILDKLPKKY